MRIRRVTFVAVAAAIMGCGESSPTPPPTPVASISDLPVGQFAAPFAGERAVASVFDHELPFQFSDNNGYLLSFWGERLSGIDGHNGYDWQLPEGTPVLATGAGTVTFAGLEPAFVCPLLNRSVSGLWVTVAHRLADGRVVLTQNGHFSRIDVRAGQRVSTGEQLGLSGTTGCSTGPHLHFATFLQNSTGTAATVFDSFGWQGTTVDPWIGNPVGTSSFMLWGASQTPPLYRELRRTGPYPEPLFVAIKSLRYLGVDDDRNPNNEFVELDVSPTRADWDLGSDTLKNSRGVAFVFPPGFRVAGGQSVRIYSGRGTNTPTALYAGSSAPLWANQGDCIRLVDTLRRTLTGTAWGTGNCGTVATIALRESPTLDFAPSPPLGLLRGITVKE